MSNFTSVSIIFNPNSTGNAEANAKELRGALAKALPNLPVTLLPTAHAGHAIELAYETAHDTTNGKVPLIVSASGDGGYNEVITGALRAHQEGAQPICAVLPSGNANDHARTMQDKPLAESIINGDITRLDVLELEVTTPGKEPVKRYAHSYIGLGLTPAVAVELNKHTLNSFKESWIVMKTFWNLRPVVIRVNDKIRKLDSLIFSIIPEMAKVLKLSENAAADDGQFEIISLPHNRKLTLIFRLVRGVFKSLEAKSRLHDYACTVIQAAPIQLDGEIMKLPANSDIKVSIRPGLLRTIV